MTIRKELSGMSLEELWELFPIFLVEHNEKWTDHYNETEFICKWTAKARKLKEEQKEGASNDYISADTKRDGETEISQHFFHD